MKLLLENWREFMNESSEDELISIKDIHKLADTLNISWDDDAEFMKWTKGLTGNSHLDEMTSEELSKDYSALEKRGKESK